MTAKTLHHVWGIFCMLIGISHGALPLTNQHLSQSHTHNLARKDATTIATIPNTTTTLMTTTTTSTSTTTAATTRTKTEQASMLPTATNRLPEWLLGFHYNLSRYGGRAVDVITSDQPFGRITEDPGSGVRFINPNFKRWIGSLENRDINFGGTVTFVLPVASIAFGLTLGANSDGMSVASFKFSTSMETLVTVAHGEHLIPSGQPSKPTGVVFDSTQPFSVVTVRAPSNGFMRIGEDSIFFVPANNRTTTMYSRTTTMTHMPSTTFTTVTTTTTTTTTTPIAQF
eukprot:m.168266 g.168266  ORF g.168266 m.168266 type:complete len:285 (-) comp15315_c0_seq1:265-1119(-)